MNTFSCPPGLLVLLRDQLQNLSRLPAPALLLRIPPLVRRRLGSARPLVLTSPWKPPTQQTPHLLHGRANDSAVQRPLLPRQHPRRLLLLLLVAALATVQLLCPNPGESHLGLFLITVNVLTANSVVHPRGPRRIQPRLKSRLRHLGGSLIRVEGRKVRAEPPAKEEWWMRTDPLLQIVPRPPSLRRADKRSVLPRSIPMCL